MHGKYLGIVFLAAALAASFLASCGSGSGDTTVACTADKDCPTGQSCLQGACQTKSPSKLCTKAEDCAAGSDCVGGQCKAKFGACFADQDCPEGMRCNITKNVCVYGDLPDGGLPADGGAGADIGAAELSLTQCSSDFQCSSPQPYCSNGWCKGCNELGCPSQAACDKASGVCEAKPSDGGTTDTGAYDAGNPGQDTGVHDAGQPYDAGDQDTGAYDAGAGCDPTSCPCGSYCDLGSGACISGCMGIGDCCAGTSCIGNRCVAVQCAQDSDCKTAPNLRCESGSGTCVECTLDYHCTGSTCDKTTWTCAPKEPGDVGAECAKDSDCQMGGMCIAEKDTSGKDTGFIGGYCSQDCTSQMYCDSYVASCILVSSSPDKRECLFDCYTNADCRTEYICVPTGTGSSGECYPRCDNPGMGCDTGYVCQTGSGQCEGTQDVTEPCAGTYNECKPGLVCAGYTGEQYHCFKECDPAQSSGPFCSGGEVCADLGTTGICEYGGTVASGGDCSTADCVKGYVCAGTSSTGYKCSKGCDKGDGSPGCTSGKTCTLLSGETRLGICK